MLGKKLWMLVEIVTTFRNYFDYVRLLRSWSNKERIILRTWDGLYLICRNNVWDARIVGETFMDKSYMKNISINANNPIVVDIGGYIGDFSLYAAKKLGARVFVYEPIPDNFNMLNDNIKINNYGNTITAWNRAVSNESELIINVARSGNDIHASGYMYADSSEKVSIKCTKLDALLSENNITEIHLLKIDCEGCEYGVLLDALPETFNYIHNIVFEYHEIPAWEAQLERLKNRLRSLGYTVIQDSDLHIMSAIKI